ncbi:MAG: class III signal peptide-containing protein [Euryarchaeota archaeon]|nr:class III signal peptide-containing protein [Euryarchaeota archaeon]
MKDKRGQVSVELILVTGLILVMAITTYPYILKQQEMNKAVAAAREGATAGAALRGMGFSTTGGNEMGIVRLEDMTLTKTNTSGERDVYEITFYLSAPDSLKTNSNCWMTSVGNTVRMQARRHIYYAFTGQWVDNLPDGVNTTYYRFTTSCEWV